MFTCIIYQTCQLTEYFSLFIRKIITNCAASGRTFIFIFLINNEKYSVSCHSWISISTAVMRTYSGRMLPLRRHHKYKPNCFTIAWDQFYVLHMSLSSLYLPPQVFIHIRSLSEGIYVALSARDYNFCSAKEN